MIRQRLERLFLVTVLLIFISSTFGCDAFRRKFTRKKKYKEIVEPVLIPEENAGIFYDNDTKYRNYFAYWRGWHDDLIQAMSGASKRRRRYSMAQALANLEQMADLLKGEKRKELLTYIQQMKKISQQIETSQMFQERRVIQQLSNIRLRINKELHYSKVKDWIKQ